MGKITVVVLAMLLLIIPVLLHIPFTIMHENAHMEAAKKQGINFIRQKLNFSILGPSGFAKPATKYDCENFNSLEKYKKQLITHAGFWRQLIIGLILIFILSLLGFISHGFLKINEFMFWIWLELIFAVIVNIISRYWFNVLSPNPYNDWHMLYFDCSKFI